MKYLLITFFCFGVPAQRTLARSDMSAARNACNIVETVIWDEFLNQGKNLPSTWQEIPTFRDIDDAELSRDLGTYKQINSLALVPDAPIIRDATGITPNFSGRRLFAISRKPAPYEKTTDQNSGPAKYGRYAILVAKDGSEIMPNWIPEPVVQIILNQIKDFDAEKQPLAFERVDDLLLEKIRKQQEWDKSISDRKEKSKKHNSVSDRALNHQNQNRSMNNTLAWMAIGLILTIGTVMVIRRRLAP